MKHNKTIMVFNKKLLFTKYSLKEEICYKYSSYTFINLIVHTGFVEKYGFVYIRRNN